MNVKPPPTHLQQNLFDVMPDKAIAHGGEARTRYGRVVEEIIIRLLGLTDIPNSGSHECVFDAHGHGSYVEIKSLREKNKLPIYEWRRTKDRECGVPLCYAIAIHRCPQCRTMPDLYAQMAETIDVILVLPAWAIDLLAHAEPVKQLVAAENGRNGYRRKGYADGYRNIPWSKLAALSYHPPRLVRGGIFDLPLTAEVRFHSSLNPWSL